jgi:hypothetical protein
LSRESTLILGADVVPVTEGNTDGRDNASAQTAWRGLTHCAHALCSGTHHWRKRSSVSDDSMTLRSLRLLDCSMRMIFYALSICLTFSRTNSPARNPQP